MPWEIPLQMDAQREEIGDDHNLRCTPLHQPADGFRQAGIAEFEKRCFDEIELAVPGQPGGKLAHGFVGCLNARPVGENGNAGHSQS